MGDNVLKAIDDETIDEVAGGYIFDAMVLTEWYASYPWEVLSKKGDVIARVTTKERAEQVAKDFGLSPKELSWDQVQRLRETGKID